MIPSRHMPPRTPAEEHTAVAWGLVLGLAGIGLWVLFQAWLHTPVFGAGLTAIVLVALWAIRHDTRQLDDFLRTRARDANERDICRFARSFDRRSVDLWVIRAVCEELSAWLSRPDVPYTPRAEDHLFRDLRLDPDDLDFDMMLAMSQRIGRSLDGFEGNPFVGKVVTVAGLVLYLNGQPRAVPTGALSSR